MFLIATWTTITRTTINSEIFPTSTIHFVNVANPSSLLNQQVTVMTI